MQKNRYNNKIKILDTNKQLIILYGKNIIEFWMSNAAKFPKHNNYDNTSWYSPQYQNS
jgi:hypothetical protein